MASGDILSAQSLAPAAKFNWIFLIELLVCGIVTLFFLFYFNRVFSKALCLLLRLYLRWKGLPHYIDIQSLQISLLAGRIFFGRVTYHGTNETIAIVGGHVTWRYWLRRVRHADVGNSKGEEIGGCTKGELPCRILLELKGLEWFIYNRSPAYDAILENMVAGERRTDASGSKDGPAATVNETNESELGKEESKTTDDTLLPKQTKSPLAESLLGHENSAETLKEEVQRRLDAMAENSPYLRILPIKIDCNRGAVVMGNNNTPSILVINFERSDGIIDAARSRSIDQYKQLINLSFTHPVIQLKSNVDYKEPLLSRGSRLLSQDEKSTSINPSLSTDHRNRRQKLRDILPFFSASVESFEPPDTTPENEKAARSRTGQDRWMGLSRYLDDSQQEQVWKSEPVEYAKVSTILDCPSAKMSFYWDIPGLVYSDDLDSSGSDDINGSGEPPEWGIDLSFEGGTIHYGPWADRQRVHLQNMFAPRLYKSATPAQKLRAGDTRMATVFKLFIELSASTILRIPTREQSKDHKFRRRRLDAGEVRPFGWLEIKVGGESTISYNMAMIPSASGWKNGLNVELKTPEVRSSVNHGLLWKGESQGLSCDLSGPLIWNGQNKWVFNNISREMRVFLLREHITLLTDLAVDWTTGPPAEYWTFAPYIYELNLSFVDFEFYFNVNDANIINSPSDFEDNTFIVLKSKGCLEAKVEMDMTRFRPDDNTVFFDLKMAKTGKVGAAGEGILQLGVRQPVWNSWNSFMKKSGETLGSVETISLKGSYNYYYTTSPGCIDTLMIDLCGEGLNLTLQGYLIRYLLIIRENYFGENLHFKTLEEWQNQQGSTDVGGGAVAATKSNDLDLVLNVAANGWVVVIPKHLYEGGEGLKLEIASLGLGLRFTNYYMDLQVDLSPISAFLVSIVDGMETPNSNIFPFPQVFIDGLTIYGHRLFGLPPAEPTYVCNWDLSVGSVTGECTAKFFQTLTCALEAFVFGFQDVENALPVPTTQAIHDVTFIRVNINSIRLWLYIDGPNVFRLTTEKISVVLNDLANGQHSERISLSIPGFTVACVDPLSLRLADDGGQPEAKTHGYIESSLEVTVFERKRDFSKQKRDQMKHVKESDFRTGRAKFLINENDESRGSSLYQEMTEPEPASMSLPGLPVPINESASWRYPGSNEGSSNYDGASRHTEVSVKKSSFLATSRSSIRTRSTFYESSHAPSFHSALESLSDAAMATPATFGPLRSPMDQSPSVIRSRHESFTEKIRKPRPSPVFSSAFAKPEFPLDSVEPDLRDVPVLHEEDRTGESDMGSPYYRQEDLMDEETAQTSIVIEMNPGIRGYATPIAIKSVVQMLDSLQQKSPEDVLDSIQIGVVNKLAELVAKKLQNPKILELCLKIPHFKFCFANPIPRMRLSQYGPGPKPDQDSYSLEFRKLVVAARSKTVFPSRENRQEDLKERRIISIHLLLESLEVTLTQLSQSPAGAPLKPVVGLLIEDLLFWASTNEVSSASLQVKRIGASIESKQAAFLFEAVERLTAFAEDLGNSFTMLGKDEERRIRDLVYYLAAKGEELGISHDPSSLTRPSYVLRSSLDHVRVNDSWKIISRMRHVFHSLPKNHRLDVENRCIGNSGQCPMDAKKQVVNAFERWRGWELANIENSYVIRDIFGVERSKHDPKNLGPVKARVVVESIRLLVDPGPTQDELTVDNIVIGISTGNSEMDNSAGSRAGATAVDKTISTIVQVHTRNVQIRLTWEILDIFEAISELLVSRDRGAQMSTEPPIQSTSIIQKQAFHIVMTTETGSIALDTVNLTNLSMAHQLQVSLVVSDKNAELQNGLLGSVLLRADYASSELCYGNKVLSVTKLRNPSLYGYFDEHCVADTRFNMWKIAGSCDDLSFDIREEVLGLMEVIDFFVNDEVAQINQLIKKLQEFSPKDPNPPRTALNTPRKVHMLDLALSLDSFSLEATLLPSLAYVLRGNGVRLSTRPKNTTEMVMDFDVLHHEHEIRTGDKHSRSQTRSISVLEMPAINGRIRDRDSVDERLFEVFLSVEAIKLDASSIQSLFNALNKPEVVNVIEEARSEWVGTQARLDDIFDKTNATPTSSIKSGTPFAYRAHAGIAGLMIQTSAPSANLEVNLGFIQVHASNRPEADSPLLSFPELHLELRRITAELTKATAKGPREVCGYVELNASLHCSSKTTASGESVRAFYVKSHSLQIDLFAETASAVVDVAGHLQDKLRDLDLSREVKYLRKLRDSKPLIYVESADSDVDSMELFNSVISVEMMGIQVSWIVGNLTTPLQTTHPGQNLVLSFKRIYFATAARKENEARLIIEEFLLQIVNANEKQIGRSENSALMPEVIFNVAYFVNSSERRFAFQAKGTSLDLRFASSCVVGASALERSISIASEKFRDASATWKSIPTQSGAERNMFGTKRLASVLVDADFAGAVFHINKTSGPDALPGLAQSRGSSATPQGRYGQYIQGESTGSTILRSPGLAFKAEYIDPLNEDPSLSAEINVRASSNTLYPSVVPLILEMSSNIKEIIREPEVKEEEKSVKESDDGKAPDPAAILGKCKLNVGLRICAQDFTLSCQPIARVAASAGYKEIYVTISTCEEVESGRFYAVSATISGLNTSLQHVYSRESTGHLEVEELVLSLMNSKHLNGSDGLSCIMKLSPIKSQVNIKQFQDFLLFREIWWSEELRQSVPAPAAQPPEPSEMLVQRYHKVAATKAFPWNTTVAISEIDLQLDLGQSLGKTALLISNFWVASRKSSDWEQTLCFGFDTIRVSSIGRLSGFVDLRNMKARTSIEWHSTEDKGIQTPLVQASLGFERLQVKASFDYQAFLIADITSFDFLMYNLPKNDGEVGDRLVGVLDGDKVQVFCTTQSASQGLALYQTFLRLTQEKMASFETSLKDVERFLNRRSQTHVPTPIEFPGVAIHKETPSPPTFLSLQTDVVVNLKEVNVGAFPSTFHDTQVFKLEALDATARFAVTMEGEKLHSKLEMTLGQLRIALSSIKRPELETSLADFSVEDVIAHAIGSRGGTILKVPQVTAFMHTWHKAGSNEIDYIFKSAFEGKVDVGWNYSRVSFIKGMWASHVKFMAQKQGKAVGSSRISINTDVSPNSPTASEPTDNGEAEVAKEKGKITAVVNVPQSRYEYKALEPPVIETPQLRDMGEATPPLEWIGLHRQRLPNLTHQIVIVSLLEVAREVEDAYSKILGSS